MIRKVHGRRRKVPVTRRRCSARLVSGTVKSTATAARARISRRHKVYATGASVATGRGRSQLILTRLRPLHSGRYALRLRSPQHRRWSTHRVTIRIDR